jgi:hypothetical protein
MSKDMLFHAGVRRVALVLGGGIAMALCVGCSNTQYSSIKNSAAFDGVATNNSALNCVPQKFRTSVIQGYQAGLNDEAKNQYWALQRAQKGEETAETTITDVDIPATVTEDGRQLTPRRLQVPFVQ